MGVEPLQEGSARFVEGGKGGISEISDMGGETRKAKTVEVWVRGRGDINKSDCDVRGGQEDPAT